MWFSLTREGGGFDAPDTLFRLQTMSAHLREQYFPLFLLILHQCLALMLLANQFGARRLDEEVPEAVACFADLCEALLDVIVTGSFNQIMQRQHHRAYLAQHDIFEAERLYRKVSDSTRELHVMLLLRKTERVQQRADEQARDYSAREKAAQERSERLGMWFAAIAFLLGRPSQALSNFKVIGGP